VVTSLRDDGARPAARNPGLTTPLIAPQSLLDVRKLGFHVAPVHGIVVSDSWGIDSDGQRTDAVVGGRMAGVEVLYQGKSLSPMTGRSKDVTVNGLPGTYTESVVSGGFVARLSWEYAPDSWAYVGAGYDGEPPPDLWQKYLTLAEAVRPGGRTLLLPVRFGAVPGSLPSLAEAHGVDVSWSDGDWTMWVTVDDVSVSATSAVDRSGCLGPDDEPQTGEFTYRGHRGCVVAGKRIGLHLDDADVFFDYGHSPELPMKDMKTLLGDMTIAKTRFDYSTWFDLRTALGR
jgi:hypothetical protein